MQLYAEYLETFHEHSDQPPEFALGGVVELYEAGSNGAYIRGREGMIVGMREKPGDWHAEPEVVFRIGASNEPDRYLEFLSFPAMRNVILASAAKVQQWHPKHPTI